MNLINIRSGKANTPTGGSECYVFYTPRPEAEGTNKVESFIGKAAREFRGQPNKPITEHGSTIVVPSLSDIPEDIGGRFAASTYIAQEGVILKVYAKQRQGWRSTMKHCVMFLRVRENAAHRIVKFTPTANNALALDWLGVQGRFDILTLKEAEAFGAKVIEMTRRLSEGSDQGLIVDEILEPESMSPVGFKETAEGKMIPRLKRRRQIEEA